MERFEKWTDARGVPLSWLHFAHGAAVIQREHSRQALRQYWIQAAVSGGDNDDQRRDWLALQRATSGWEAR